jgi:type I restriction enzyme, R subunit
MRHELVKLNPDLAKQHPNYVVRITADEKEIGKGFLDQFMDVETDVPTIVTTSKLLTTGVDVPTCKNIVLVSVINSMTEFKQIIGRGTRVRDDYGKLYFSILDYTGSATRLFADPDFDGEPALVTETSIDAEGMEVEEPQVLQPEEVLNTEEQTAGTTSGMPIDFDDNEHEPRKFYVDDGWVAIVADLVYELDSEGRKLNPVEFTEYVADNVKAFATNTAELRKMWADPQTRAEVIEGLGERGIDFDHLSEVLKQPEADRFDLLCHVAFSAPVRSRKERAESLLRGHKHYFQQYSEQAQQILNELIAKYVEFGMEQFKLPEVLKVPPLSEHGNPSEITKLFGTASNLREAFASVQSMLYLEDSK